MGGLLYRKHSKPLACLTFPPQCTPCQ
jgi:hypothetical protein